MVLPFSTSGGMSSVTLPLRTGDSPITRWIAAFMVSGAASARRTRRGTVASADAPAAPASTTRRVYDSVSPVIASSSVAQSHQESYDVFDLFRRQYGLAAKRRRDPFKSIQAVIGRHHGVRIRYARIDDPQPQLAFRIPRADTLEAGPDGALELLLRQRRRVT